MLASSAPMDTIAEVAHKRIPRSSFTASGNTAVILARDADKIVEYEQAQWLSHEVPSSRLETIPGGSHMLHYFHQDRFASAIACMWNEAASPLAQRGG